MTENMTKPEETEKMPSDSIFKRFTDNLLNLRTLYPEAPLTILRCGAYYSAAWGRSIPERSLLSCMDELEKSGLLIGAEEYTPFAAAALCAVPDAENRMRRVQQDCRLLKDCIPDWAKRSLAGILSARLARDDTDADELISKIGKIGAGDLDSPCRRLLLAADEEDASETDARLKEAKRLLCALYGAGKNTESLAYAVSCFRKPEAVSMKLCLLQRLLKRRGLNPGSVCCLAGLAGKENGCEEAAERVAEVNAYLKRQPGFGIFAISAAERAAWSCLLLGACGDGTQKMRLTDSGRAALMASFSLLAPEGM